MIGVYVWAALVRLRLWRRARRMVPDRVPRLADTEAQFERMDVNARWDLLVGLAFGAALAAGALVLLVVPVVLIAGRVS